jgi:AraC-like DNA-binding protein
MVRMETSGESQFNSAPFKSHSDRRNPSVISKDITIELHKMDVVLSVSTPSVGSLQVGTQVSRSSPNASFANAIPLNVDSAKVTQCLKQIAQPCVDRTIDYLIPGGLLNDPIIERLSRALQATGQGAGHFDDLYADAVRLAMVTRLLCLRSECDRNTKANKSQLPKWRLKRVTEYINSRYMHRITLAELASVAGLSAMHFACQFRLATGFRPHEFVLRHRIERSQQLLSETTESVVNVALSVGFVSQSHFTTVFKRYVGDTPHRWRCRAAIELDE